MLAEFRNPVAITTKNHLVTRDIDLLSELAEHQAAAVALSITTLDDGLQRIMEPRTSSPSRRLEAIARMAEAGVPVAVTIAPVVPGLTDHELPGIVEAAAEAGAVTAGYIMLRLPHGVRPAVRALAGATATGPQRKGPQPDPGGARRSSLRFALRGAWQRRRPIRQANRATVQGELCEGRPRARASAPIYRFLPAAGARCTTDSVCVILLERRLDAAR